MMKFFRLLDDMTSTNRWHLGEVTFQDGTEPWLVDGIRLDNERTLSARVTHPGPPLDFCLTSFAVPVAAVKLARAIAEVAGDDVQCLPLHVVGHSDRVVLNATRLARCLDESRSEFMKWTERDHRADLAGHYRMVPKLILDPKVIPPDAHFFRVERWSIALIVSEVVREAMERAGCMGADFRDVNPPPGK